MKGGDLMNEEIRETATRDVSWEEGAKREAIRPMAKPQQLLDIAKEFQEFIDSKNWSWCDMERVYRILKTVNG